jgi:DNA-binding response OmpR family regulator
MVDQTQKTVLIIDDDGQWRRLLRIGLEHAGYLVEDASNSNDAVDLLEKRRYSAVISDNAMIDRNAGTTLLYWMRDVSLLNQSTPFMLLTADDSQETKDRVERLKGVYQYKGDSRKPLTEVLQAFLGSPVLQEE